MKSEWKQTGMLPGEAIYLFIIEDKNNAENLSIFFKEKSSYVKQTNYSIKLSTQVKKD